MPASPFLRTTSSSAAQSTSIGLGLGLLLLVTWLVYRPGFSGPLYLDAVSNLPQTQLEQLSLDALRAQFFALDSPYPGVRGLGRVSFAISQWLSTDPAPALKGQELMIHLLNGVLIFWLLLLWMQQRPPPSGADASPWIALTVTGFWLLHPLQVSTVLYVVQRYTLLSTLFSLLALLAYTKGRVWMTSRPMLGVAVAAIGVIGFTLCGLFSKETAALIPLMLLCVEHFIFQWRFGPSPKQGRAAWLTLALLLVPVVVGTLFAVTHFSQFVGGFAQHDFTMGQRLLTQPHVIALYLGQIFIPVPSSMSLFHDAFPITLQLDSSTALLAIGYALAVLIALALRSRTPWFGFAVIWFFACHALEASFLPLEMVFEHRNYLAILGPALLVVLGVLALLGSPTLHRLRIPALALVLLMLGMNTASRATVWGNEPLMLHLEYQRRPSSPRVLAGLAILEMRHGNLATADRYVAELRATGLASAGPELMRIGFRCNERAPARLMQPKLMDRQLVDAAIASLDAHRTDAFAAQSLIKLANAVFQDDCPQLGATQLHRLAAAARHSSPSPSGFRCSAAGIAALALLHARSTDQLRQPVHQALADCRQTSPFRYPKLLQNLLVISARTDQLPLLLDVLRDSPGMRPEDLAAADLPPWLRRAAAEALVLPERAGD